MRRSGAAGLVAVVSSPVRERVRRRVNRLVYGERDDPYGVLSEPGALDVRLDVRLDCAMTRSRLATRLRGAREFLTPGPGGR